MAEPVLDSPTKAIALMSGCSVSALPASSPRPLTRFATPSGSPASLQDLGQQQRGERAPFGRLVDDRAAGRQRRRDLPGRQHERRVPRRDHADRSDRLAHGVVEVLLRGQRQAVTRLGRAVGEEAEVLGRAQRRLRHVADGLPRVHALDHRDLLFARFDQIGHAMQQALSLFARQVAPGRECALRCLRGRIDVGGVAAGDFAEARVVDRRQIVEALSRSGRHRVRQR